ncbi:uncharacterized protein LOC143450893 [Clavelina lepadiformis]|uniref:RWD domain-containing protein n=1 Tax=Clavelina lepadiformis TaxID=159417 RepID=A0ABP0FZJ6_CLALP
MSVITEELEEVQKFLCSNVDGIDIISCHKHLVTIKILKTKHRELTACIQFPNNYPDAILLVEIKSKVMSPSLMSHINQICDQELKKFVGQKQVFQLTKFLRRFLDENPLLPCRDELTYVKKELIEDGDSLKMKQKQGVITAEIKQNKYNFKFTVSVPDKYPVERITIQIDHHTFPACMTYYFISQAREFARQAVEPPLRKDKKKSEFSPSPHIKKVMEFLIKGCAKRYPLETCPLCDDLTLPEDPKEIINNAKDAKYAERIYCGHLYHHGCLDKYMKTPPFQEGKKCPKCSHRIYHDKWNINPKLAEDRWAHQEARQRELDEVMDFLS